MTREQVKVTIELTEEYGDCSSFTHKSSGRLTTDKIARALTESLASMDRYIPGFALEIVSHMAVIIYDEEDASSVMQSELQGLNEAAEAVLSKVADIRRKQ